MDIGDGSNRCKPRRPAVRIFHFRSSGGTLPVPGRGAPGSLLMDPFEGNSEPNLKFSSQEVIAKTAGKRRCGCPVSSERANRTIRSILKQQTGISNGDFSTVGSVVKRLTILGPDPDVSVNHQMCGMRAEPRCGEFNCDECGNPKDANLPRLNSRPLKVSSSREV